MNRPIDKHAGGPATIQRDPTPRGNNHHAAGAPASSGTPSPRPESATQVSLPGWVILPLRLFLGVSFLAAGLDKLTDPAYLNPSAGQYIGRQINLMAQGSPIGGFLTGVAEPNANLFGVLVMGGELLIGVAVLLGLLTRLSAFMGLLLNLTFFLSATWEVRPFYFGADLPYAFGWLTLLLAGAGPLALDRLLAKWVQPVSRTSPAYGPGPSPTSSEMFTRRAVVGAGFAGLVGVALASAGLGWSALHSGSGGTPVTSTGPEPTPSPVPNMGGQASTPAPTAPLAPTRPVEQPPTPTTEPTQPVAAAPTETSTPENTAQLIAAAGSLPEGQQTTFTLPTGEPAVLAHNASGYSAYVAICTHQACEVHPVNDGLIVCPCHGSMFDTNARGDVVRGPARRPLSTVQITVDAKGNVYLAD